MDYEGMAVFPVEPLLLGAAIGSALTVFFEEQEARGQRHGAYRQGQSARMIVAFSPSRFREDAS